MVPKKKKKMNRLQWKSRRNMGIFLGVVAAYLIVRVRKYEEIASVFLPKVHPNEPWEFIADFSHMKFLNPTITDFIITAESGNYEHWKYTVEYSEQLSHWPHLANHAVAHFQIKSSPKTNNYLIQSVHKTCLFLGMYCCKYSRMVLKSHLEGYEFLTEKDDIIKVMDFFSFDISQPTRSHFQMCARFDYTKYIAVESINDFKFSKSNHTDGALCEEKVIYECPAFLSSFCRREVRFQRDAIMSNLKKYLINQ